MTEEEVRPRFGAVIHEDKSETPIYFVPQSEDEFMALDAKTDEPAEILPGDILRVDVIGPGQSILVSADGGGKRVQPPSGWRSERSDINKKFRDIIMHEDKEKEIMGESDDKKKYPAGQAIAMLLGLGVGTVGIVVLAIAGVRWALSL